MLGPGGGLLNSTQAVRNNSFIIVWVYLKLYSPGIQNRVHIRWMPTFNSTLKYWIWRARWLFGWMFQHKQADVEKTFFSLLIMCDPVDELISLLFTGNIMFCRFPSLLYKKARCPFSARHFFCLRRVVFTRLQEDILSSIEIKSPPST